jgi:hypothetical protein
MPPHPGGRVENPQRVQLKFFPVTTRVPVEKREDQKQNQNRQAINQHQGSSAAEVHFDGCFRPAEDAAEQGGENELERIDVKENDEKQDKIKGANPKTASLNPSSLVISRRGGKTFEPIAPS